MSLTPNYASTPTVGAATLTAADASRSAPTTSQSIFAPANGGQCERITIAPLGNTAQSVIRIFRYDGASYHLYTEIQVGTVTASATVAGTTTTLEAVNNPNLFPIMVPSGWSLRATVNDAQAAGIKVQGEGGGF